MPNPLEDQVTVLIKEILAEMETTELGAPGPYPTSATIPA